MPTLSANAIDKLKQCYKISISSNSISYCSSPVKNKTDIIITWHYVISGLEDMHLLDTG